MPSISVKTRNGDTGNALPPDQVLFGHSVGMEAVRKRLEKICTTDVPLLLYGDPGTGKELLARWVHERSPYREGQFVKVNCAAIPGNLLESEIFGYEKGAFTGARTTKPGRVELAHKGTLFLDQIADLDLSLQSKLLHFVQDGSFCRIGGETEQYVDTRIICASTRNLQSEIAAGRFRSDLYYRISVLEVRLPRLADRKEDVPLLADYFHAQYRKEFEKDCEPLGPKVLASLETLDWPGNVRQLSNFIARYVLIGQDAFAAEDFPQKRKVVVPRSSSEPLPNMPLKGIAKEAIREMERNVIMEALRTHQWNRRKAAEALKISYRALIYKIRDAGLGSRRRDLAEAVTRPSAATEAAAN